jgi:GNAT superfamily N-acetyltransferase
MSNTARKAGLPDIDTLVDLMEAFYAESGYTLDRQWASASFRKLLADQSLGTAWLLCHKGQPAGYLVLTVRFAMEYGGLDGFIDDLFVVPSFRRIGLARLGLHTLIDECRCRGVMALHVEVARENTAANTLYTAFGLHPYTDGRQLLTAVLDTDTIRFLD